jgi:hypothetical protein
MSHDHKHDEHGHHHNHQTHPKTNRAIHHSPLFWLAVIAMLAGMFVYVMSDDESLQPGGGEGPPVPAAE